MSQSLLPLLPEQIKDWDHFQSTIPSLLQKPVSIFPTSFLVWLFKLLYTVPGPPQDIHTSVVDKTSLTVFWSKPKSTNGLLQGYQVIYTVHSNDDQVRYYDKLHTMHDNS